MVAFEALCDSSTRVNAMSKTEGAWVTHVASQGNSKVLNKLTKPWEKAAKQGVLKEPENQANAFLERFGGGF